MFRRGQRGPVAAGRKNDRFPVNHLMVTIQPHDDRSPAVAGNRTVPSSRRPAKPLNELAQHNVDASAIIGEHRAYGPAAERLAAHRRLQPLSRNGVFRFFVLGKPKF